MAKATEIERRWFVLDAAGKPLGRVAATAATILNGKHRPEYTRGVDCGEFVIIINATIKISFKIIPKSSNNADLKPLLMLV